MEKNTYAIDAAHSNVEFVVRHLMISRVRGRFGTLKGTIEASPDGMPSSLDVTVETGSVDTRESQRDTHLRSADFFEVEKYPEMTYKANRVEGSPQDFTVHGQLTIRGVTRDVPLRGRCEGTGKDPYGNERLGYEAGASINRKDFGLTWNPALEAGGVMVSDEVKIEVSAEAVRQ